LFSNIVGKWLETALDFGILEADFWQMTFAELERYFSSRQRVIAIEEQKRASFDYILADLIGRSVSRLYSSANKMPPIQEAYPSLFDSDEVAEKVQQRKNELSVLRFKHFAQSHNKKIKGGAQKKQ
jgi:hypothetical protein